MAGYSDGIEVRTSANSPLQLMKGPDAAIQKLIIDDGRLSFATDTKKIYLDCKFTDSADNTWNDRIAFGGSSGIFYGTKTFDAATIELNVFEFTYGGDSEDFDENTSECPEVDDLILNQDGCFYRVISVNASVHEVPVQVVDPDTGETVTSTRNVTTAQIVTRKLTVAGSGGGGGGGGSGISAAKDPDQNYNIIYASGSIPIGFKVSDSIEGTTIDVMVTINGIVAGTRRKIDKDEYTFVECWPWRDYFTINANNTVLLTFSNEYGDTRSLKIDGIRLVALETKLSNANLGVVTTESVRVNIQPFGASNMYERWINVSVKFPNIANEEVFKMPFASTIDNGEIFAYDIDLSRHIIGDYTARIWITARAEEGDTEILTSPAVTAAWIWQDPNSSTPILSANLEQNSFTQYDTATITYLVSYNSTNTVTVNLQAYCDDELLLNADEVVSFNTNTQWKYTFNRVKGDKQSTYKFIISVPSYSGLSKTLDNITVKKAEITPPIIEEDTSLQLYLNANPEDRRRSNNEAHPDTWEYKNIACTFENFNWSTNGWITDTNDVTSLKLTNGAKLTVPFAIFSEANTQNSGAQITGKTVEINFKLSNVRNVNSILINAASWWNNKIRTGIVCTGDKICMNTPNLTNYHTAEEDMAMSDSEKAATNGLRAYLAEDERVHVAFSIYPVQSYMNPENPTEVLDTYGLIYTYVNGVLSGLTKYDSAETIIDAAASAPSYLIFDSTDADIDIYSIRVYGKYCADSILLNNYAADLPTAEQRMFVKTNNDVLVNGEISLNRVRELGNIPYLVVTDLRRTGDKKGNLIDSDDNVIGYGPEAGSTHAITNGKKDFRWAPCYYVDPEHPDRNFGDPNNLVEAVMYGQGTSSMAYPVKNFRLRFRNKADKYSLLPAIPGIDNDPVEKAKWENMPKVALFTAKADYMDSSMSHNVGTGNLLAGLYDSIALKSPAQLAYPDKTLTTNIVGRPMIVFWRPGEIGSETYIGRYNFNTDKAEHSLFGFDEAEKDGFFGRVTETVNGEQRFKWGFQSTLDESDSWDDDELYNKTYYTAPNLESEWEHNGIRDGGKAMKTALGQGPLYEYVEGPRSIQCWEFLNNGAALDGFRTGWDGNLNDWVASFESRYPEHQETKVDADHKYQFCSDNRAFARLINWLHSTDQSQATDEPLSSAVTYSGTTYDKDSKEYRLAKFVAELDQYMDINFTLFYYVLTETLLMIDSRGKNMMMCSFDLDSDAGTGHWFPIFYDMDTILGVDNSGVLRYSYDVDDATETIYNASANYGTYVNGVWQANPNYSTLWCNLRMGYPTQIKTMYNNLRSKKFNLEYLLSSYNDQFANTWAEIYDNKDGWYKYIRPLTTVTTVTVNGKDETRAGINWIHAEQGTRSMHREYFLKHRFAYLDSKYATGTNGTEDIYLRVNVPLAGVKEHPDPHSLQFDLTSQSTQYGATKFGGNGTLDITSLPAETTVRTPLPTGVDTAKDVETYVFNMGDIYDIGDLSDKFLTSIEFKRPNRLRRFQLGNASPAYKSSEAVSISGFNNLTLLEVFDVQNAKLQATSVDLSNQKYFRELYAKGSNITAVNFAEGGNLQHVELPSSITSITIKNNLFYDTINHPENLQIESYGSLESLNISGCPKVNTYSLISNIMAQDESESGQIVRVRLPDVNWTINELTEDTAVLEQENDDMIATDIKILAYIANIPGGFSGTTPPAPVSHGRTNNEYFGGTVTINNQNVLIDDYALKNKYSQQFPNLTLIYTNPENVIAGYDIYIHNGQGDVQYALGGKANSVTLSREQANGYNLKDHLENNTTMPAIASTQQWDYIFKGWSYTDTVHSDQDAVVDAALDISAAVVLDDDGQVVGYTYEDAPTEMSMDLYHDQALHIYPVFKMELRKHKVTYMYTEKGVTPEVVFEEKEQTYGSIAEPPSKEAMVLVLDPDDKTKTTVRRLSTYEFNGTDYSSWVVTDQITFYPVYAPAIEMKDMVNPPTSYYTAVQNTVEDLNGHSATITWDGNDEYDILNGVVLTINSSVEAEALCVPKAYDGKPVVAIKNQSPNIKRLYFEAGSAICYIPADTGFATLENLEYVDLAALTQLHTLGALTGTVGVFNNDTNLTISGLPNSLAFIGNYAFANCSALQFSAMPKNLINIGSYAFSGCTNLKNINYTNVDYRSNPDTSEWLTDHNDGLALNQQWPMIADHAFYNCNQLTFDDANDFSDVAVIGESAFEGCRNLVWDMNSTNGLVNTSIQVIGSKAFRNCKKLTLSKLPENVVEIGSFAFANSETPQMESTAMVLNLINIPSSLRKMDTSVFQNTTIQNTYGSAIIWHIPTEVDLTNKISQVNGANMEIHANALKGMRLTGITFASGYYWQPTERRVENESYNEEYAIEGIAPWTTGFANGWGAVGYEPNNGPYSAQTSDNIQAVESREMY